MYTPSVMIVKYTFDSFQTLVASLVLSCVWVGDGMGFGQIGQNGQIGHSWLGFWQICR